MSIFLVNAVGQAVPRESLPVTLWAICCLKTGWGTNSLLRHYPSLLILELQYFRWLASRRAVERHSNYNRSLPCLTTNAKLHLGDCWCLLPSLLRQVTLKLKEGGSCLAISELARPCNLSLVMGTLHDSTLWIPLHTSGYASLDFGIWGRWLTKSHFIEPLITQGGWANVI